MRYREAEAEGKRKGRETDLSRESTECGARGLRAFVTLEPEPRSIWSVLILNRGRNATGPGCCCCCCCR